MGEIVDDKHASEHKVPSFGDELSMNSQDGHPLSCEKKGQSLPCSSWILTMLSVSHGHFSMQQCFLTK